MFLDGRHTEYISIHRSIPLLYAPYLGAEAFRVYTLYVALANSEGHAEVSEGDIMRFLGIQSEVLEEAHRVLESHNLIQFKKDSAGLSGFVCTLLPPPPLPEDKMEDLASRSLPVETGAVLPKPPAPKRSQNRSKLTPSKLINKFYRAIQQTRIDSTERDMAKAEVADLREDGYSLEDIDAAVQWTLANQDVIVQPVESFAVIRDTIDQALAEREQARMDQLQSQVDEVVQDDERQKQRRMIDEFRKTLSKESLDAVRQRALQRIEEDGSIVPELVTESFIRIQEDAILLDEYMRDSFEEGADLEPDSS